MSKNVFKKGLYTALDEQRAYSLGSSPSSGYRTEYRKDYGRLIHSPAFRRLQGKTQLFPSNESDFSRNRLTHSIEVAQIAKSIALKINHEFLLSKDAINVDIVEVAALAHDLGHPPFGHNGELALDECMRKSHGGFEGNAQTLRILAKLEKKVASIDPRTKSLVVVNSKNQDCRFGLNLTARTLAAVLKYDYKIPLRNSDRIAKYRGEVAKGYYNSESELVTKIKKAVLGINSLPQNLKFKTIECQIMDIADDIAYSTYDLEDAFKADFLDPLKLISRPNSFYKEIAGTVKKKLDSEYSEYPKAERNFADIDVILRIVKFFDPIFNIQDMEVPFEIAGHIAQLSKQASCNGYERTGFTSSLVGSHVEKIKFEPNEKFPALSIVKLDIETFKMVETMKTFAYNSLIMSPMLKLAEYRGKDIVKRLFEVLSDGDGYMLLPNDFKELYLLFAGNKSEQKRLICDFIAGMTDKYAMDFYNRIFGTTAESIHKPL